MNKDYNNMLKDIVQNYKKITGVELNELFNTKISEDSAIFNQEIINKTVPKIKEYLMKKYGFNPDKNDEFWYDLDEMLEKIRKGGIDE